MPSKTSRTRNKTIATPDIVPTSKLPQKIYSQERCPKEPSLNTFFQESAAVAKNFLELGENFHRVTMLCAKDTEHFSSKTSHPPFINPLTIGRAFWEAGQKLSQNPSPTLEATQSYYQDYVELCQTTYRHLTQTQNVRETKDVITPTKGDRRFKDQAWTDSPSFSFLKQSYLLWDRWIQNISTNIEGLDSKTAHKVEFYTRQFANTLSPSNYFWSNPQTLKYTLETNGNNLVQGISNFLKDVEEGQGSLKISMVEKAAFSVGKNIATTPGKVVFQNELVQIIQYKPTTKEVYEIPVLLVPPCINKFYVFDLREDNSFVRWLLDQGFSVFIVSWVNPKSEHLSHKTFDDYVIEGIGASVNAVSKITAQPKINTLGFCIGGNFLASYAGYQAHDKKSPLNSTTYLATLFDFENAGDLQVFIDEEQITQMEKAVKSRGFFDGDILGRTFNLLRSNDLIWSFVINNYLMGKDPMAFDLLYWNSDSTNLPATMYLYYIRKMFLENRLLKPDGLTIKGRPIDLSKVTTPTFILNTREDHIAPWRCGYAGAKTFSGPTQFVLGGSGHVAGIFNHPKSKKYSFWTGKTHNKQGDDWLKTAKQTEGSWWGEWHSWLAKLSGKKILARHTLGSQDFPPLENAPGSYVK